MIASQLHSELPASNEKTLLSAECITDIHSGRSAGSLNEFYSEGDYWWPNPDTPDGLPYVKRDGLSNPDIFNGHRELLINMCMQVAGFTEIYKNTGNRKYAEKAVKILQRWFIDRKTRMEPHLKYAQAIPGICSGRGIGIIDTVHLAETALAILKLRELRVLDPAGIGITAWFEEYLDWLLKHDFGIQERSHGNNHATCWYVQAAAFAKLTGNHAVTDMCRRDYKRIILPRQMAGDGSFPDELKRTKPYCYSIFNLEAMSALCRILSTDEDDLFHYETATGQSMRQGMEFMYPFLLDKNSWPYGKDVMYWKHWPNKQSCLLFCGLAFNKKKYLDLWRKLTFRLDSFEGIRNLPVKTPGLWLEDKLQNNL